MRRLRALGGRRLQRRRSSAAAAALVVLGDVRTGLPGGGDERDGGDGAAAFLFGDATAT